MSSCAACVEGARTVGAVAFLVVATVVTVAVAPFVSAVAVPIFATKALINWVEYKPLHDRTLTNLTREKFGRVPGQDYTRWNGRAVVQVNANPTEIDKMHEAIGSYVKGTPKNLSEAFAASPFSTVEDLVWLDREVERREVEDLLNEDLKMLRAFSKALIPIIGFFWVLFTELSFGGASQIGCSVCRVGRYAEDSHWDWREAIHFHKQNLQSKLASA